MGTGLAAATVGNSPPFHSNHAEEHDAGNPSTASAWLNFFAHG
jgi:hypothetical protein